MMQRLISFFDVNKITCVILVITTFINHCLNETRGFLYVEVEKLSYSLQILISKNDKKIIGFCFNSKRHPIMFTIQIIEK